MRGERRPLDALAPGRRLGVDAGRRRTAYALDWHPEHGDRCQHVVFTSPALDRTGLLSLLGSCLLTDDELAAGPGTWPPPTGFDDLLDTAA